MIANHRDTPAARSGYRLRGAVYRARQRRVALLTAATGNVDRVSPAAEGNGNAAPRPAAGASHHYHAIRLQAPGSFPFAGWSRDTSSGLV